MRILYRRGLMKERLQDYKGALVDLLEAKTLAEAVGQRQDKVAVLLGLGRYNQGAAAIDYLMQALDLLPIEDEKASLEWECQLCTRLVNLLAAMGFYDIAMRFAMRLADVYFRKEDSFRKNHYWCVAAACARLAGYYGYVQSILDHVFGNFELEQNPVPLAYEEQGRFYWDMGHFEKAQQAFKECYSLHERYGSLEKLSPEARQYIESRAFGKIVPSRLY